MTQIEKEEQIGKLKIEAFDTFQHIENAKVHYNKLLQTIAQLQQAPTDAPVIDETNGIDS